MNKRNSSLKASLRYFRLTLIFASVVFVIILATMMLIFTGTHILVRLGVIQEENFAMFPLFCVASLIIGTILAMFFSKAPLRPIREMISATERISDGDYTVRLHLKGPEEFRILSEKFNHMAEELGSVEMLRNDFVSNFSHEFKTPIVSIRGFARALQWENLSSEERAEYLDIIIKESDRLADLSSNVLYLSSLEQQTILTDKKYFNISEQIRQSVALLDHKLTEKHLEITMDGPECYILGNEEMLKQVWINLLDNAIKFSPDNGKIEWNVTKAAEDNIIICISNESPTLSEEILNHVFDKFYQGDLSHSAPGNGLGLAIVKKILELHNGQITVSSGDWKCTFKISLKTENAGVQAAINSCTSR